MFGDYIDIKELIKRIFKYVSMGLIVAIVSYVIPKKSLNVEEIIMLALAAGATFAMLDTYMPAVGMTARTGFGFGTGLALSGLVL